MKKYLTTKIILRTLLVILVVIQFIRPSKNVGEAFGVDDVTKTVNVPDDVKNILVASCYDCHSNHTNHMWYENIQPIGWWIANHINEGKRELNFSEYEAYSLKRKLHKLEEIKEMVDGTEMPLPSYLWIHGEAELSADQKAVLSKWVTETRAYLSDTISRK